MSKPTHEVADIIRLHGRAYRKTYQPPIQVCKVLPALSLCRTAALGGHVEVCKSCGTERISYNSCRNRHCPKCQCINREKWIMARESELLPVPYYHIVFTLPIVKIINDRTPEGFLTYASTVIFNPHNA